MKSRQLDIHIIGDDLNPCIGISSAVKQAEEESLLSQNDGKVERRKLGMSFVALD